MSTIETSHKSAITVPAIGWNTAGVRMSVAEFDAIEEYDELYRYELIHGVLVVLPIPQETQAAPNECLGYLLHCYRSQFSQHGTSVETLSSRYIHTKHSRRLADRVIWAGLGRVPNPAEDVPAIAVEFVSAGRRNWIRDYETKRDEYLAAGVQEYWIIDRFARTMTVYSAGDDSAGDNVPGLRVVAETETYHTPLLPGFELPLALVLAEADKWNQET